MPPTARNTRQQAEIVAALRRAPKPLSAAELFLVLRGAGSRIALATIYRNLHRLAEQGTADRIVRSSGEATFRICSSDHHHHHLICRDCGRVAEVGDCELDAWAGAVAGREGFVDVEHAVELVGRCEACAAAPDRVRRTPVGATAP